MLSRFVEREEQPIALPAEWVEKFHSVLDEQYKSDLDATNRKFELFSELYPNEICLGICLVSKEVENTLPVTFIISSDLDGKTAPLDLLDRIIDSVEVFFDQFFSNEAAFEYEVLWLESETGGLKFHYLASRENLVHTKMANDLLGKDFPV